MVGRGVSAETKHPFEPTHAGMACRVVKYPEWTVCGKGPSDPIHTGTRPAPPELEAPYPPCSMCGKGTDWDDGFYCTPCGASWSDVGREGSWDEPELSACTSTHKPFDRPDLGAEHEGIRHHVEHCQREDGHDGKHRSDEFTEWGES